MANGNMTYLCSPPEQISDVQAVVAPTKLTVALEAPPLVEQLVITSKEEKDFPL